MGFLALGGLSTFTPYGAPGSVGLVLSGVVLTIWSALFVAGPLVTAVGIYWKGRIVTSLGIEQVGLMLTTGACLMYDVALIAASDDVQGALFIASFVTAIAIANVWRFCQTVSRMRFIVAASRPRTGEGGM
jgi:hypothetical protein